MLRPSPPSPRDSATPGMRCIDSARLESGNLPISSATMLSIAAVSLRFWLSALFSAARKPVTTMSALSDSGAARVGSAGSGALVWLSAGGGTWLPAVCWAIAGAATNRLTRLVETSSPRILMPLQITFPLPVNPRVQKACRQGCLCVGVVFSVRPEMRNTAISILQYGIMWSGNTDYRHDLGSRGTSLPRCSAALSTVQARRCSEVRRAACGIVGDVPGLPV